MKFSPKRLIIAAAAMAFAIQSASAAFTFNNGDLIMGFQATGGTGSTKNVFFNLGSPIAYRDGTNPSGTIGNISTTLTAVYGATWYNRSDLFFGVIGNLNQQPTSGIGSRTAVAGDPSRTFYVSSATATPGSGASYPANTYSSSSLGTAGNNLSGLEANLPGFTTEADSAAILDQTTQPTQWNNGWTFWNPTPGASFGTFTGGIQQNFGQATPSTYLDLQRVLATNTGANPVGLEGGGTYETTFAISNTGAITAVPEPSAALLCGLGALALLRRRRA